MKVVVITVSDRASRGEYEDLSGPEIEKEVKSRFADAAVTRRVVPDEPDDILAALQASAGADFILTTGGTGLSPRDVTPETTRRFIERELPGISECLRAQSYAETPAAVLSRGVAGMKGSTIVVNFPGSAESRPPLHEGGGTGHGACVENDAGGRTPLMARTRASKSLVDRVYEYLLDQIITGAIRYGDTISIKGVAGRLSVSSMPVREALEKTGVRGRGGHQAAQLVHGARAVPQDHPGSLRASGSPGGVRAFLLRGQVPARKPGPHGGNSGSHARPGRRAGTPRKRRRRRLPWTGSSTARSARSRETIS